ncbi:MAG TPA: FtsX-like permease family protein [Cellulomonas sp.]
MTAPTAPPATTADFTWGRLLLRHLRLSGARWAVLAVVVALTSALAMVWPRWLAATTTAELRRDLGAASSSFVDPTTAPGRVPLEVPLPDVAGYADGTAVVPGGAAGAGAAEQTDPWAEVSASLARQRAGLPEPLRSVLGDPGYWMEWKPLLTPDAAVADRDQMSVQPASAPQLLDHARIVDGRAPALDEPPVGADAPLQLEIAMSVESAQQMRWSVGDARSAGSVGPDGERPLDVVLVGTFQPDDPGSGYWQSSATLLRPSVVVDTNGITVTARGLVSAGAGLRTVTQTTPDAGSRLWYPLQIDRIDAADAGALAEQLRTELRAVPLGGGQTGAFATEAPGRIDEVLARASAARSVLALAVAAPAGVLLALLALAAQVVVGPRRGAHLLAALRGASLVQHRLLLGTEAAVVCLPAAAAGGLLAGALVPAHVGPWWWLAPAALGLVPVLALATASPAPRSAPAPRVAVEIATAVLATAAVVQLVARGTGGGGGGGGGGTDVLAVVAPLLLAVVAALVCARLVPWLLRPLAARLRRRDGLVAPLGAMLAARQPQPVVASVAMVAGTAVALLGVLVTSTIDAGRTTAALRDVGADVRVLGSLDDAHVAALRAVPGVRQVAPVAATSSVGLRTGANTQLVTTLYAADAALTDVQQGVPGAVAVPPVGSLAVASAVPIGTDGLATLTTSPPLSLTVTTRSPAAAGLTSAKTWMLVNRRTLQGTNVRFVATAAYLALDDHADPVAVAAAVRDVVGPGVAVATAHEQLEQLRTAPTARALSTGILVVVIAGLLAAMLAVALALAARSASRTRVVAVLRTMGLPPRAELRLVLWEATPTVAVAVLAGTALGFGLTQLLLTSIDVRPFTGGDEQPHLVIGPSLAVALGAVLLAAAGAVLVSAWAAARRSAAVVLRAGEERP